MLTVSVSINLPHCGYALMRSHTSVYGRLSKKSLGGAFVWDSHLVEDWNIWNRSVNTTPCEFNHVRQMIRILLVGRVLIGTRSGDVLQTSYCIITGTWLLAAGTRLAREKRWSGVKSVYFTLNGKQSCLDICRLPSSRNSILFISAHEIPSSHCCVLLYVRFKWNPTLEYIQCPCIEIFCDVLSRSGANLLLHAVFPVRSDRLPWWCHRETLLDFFFQQEKKKQTIQQFQTVRLLLLSPEKKSGV